MVVFEKGRARNSANSIKFLRRMVVKCAGAGLCECEAAVRFRIIVFATPVVIGCVDHENEWSCAVAEARSIRCFASSDVNWPSSFR